MVFGVCYTVTPAYVIVLIIYEITAFLFNCWTVFHNFLHVFGNEEHVRNSYHGDQGYWKQQIWEFNMYALSYTSSIEHVVSWTIRENTAC